MTLHLRKYQEQALTAERTYRTEHPNENRLAIVLATGLGKTIVMAERAVRFLDSFEGAGNRVLILVHTDELAQQAEAKVRLMAGRYTVGVVKAERDEVDADIVIGSVATLANPARRARLDCVGLVIVDECHHAVSDSYQAIMRHYGCYPNCDCRNRDPEGCWDCRNTGYTHPPTPVLGLTATLERGDGASLGGVWHNVVFTRDISWGVRKGYLVQPIGYKLEIPGLALGDRSSMTGEPSLQAGSLDAAMVDSIAPDRVVEWWQEHAEGRPTVLFAPLVRSAEAFSAAFTRAGTPTTVVHGNLARMERVARLTGYELGEVAGICNAMVLTEGWDSPRTKCVIIARPTQSRPLFIQMAGRGLRPEPLKPVEEQNCILLVVGDATTDMCTVADLSDRPLERNLQGPLTAMEDEWDIGKGIEDAERHWAGKVDAREFDPLVRRSAKVWRRTKGGTPFLPYAKDGHYLFIVGTSVFVREHTFWTTREMGSFKISRLHKDLPDLELALSMAEDEATERGGDIGALLADRTRAWRKGVPNGKTVEYATRLGLKAEVDRILATRESGKAGKVSDLISRVEATRVLDPIVEKIKGMVGAE